MNSHWVWWSLWEAQGEPAEGEQREGGLLKGSEGSWRGGYGRTPQLDDSCSRVGLKVEGRERWRQEWGKKGKEWGKKGKE